MPKVLQMGGMRLLLFGHGVELCQYTVCKFIIPKFPFFHHVCLPVNVVQ